MEADETVGRAAGIVAAYVAHNSLPGAELPGLIGSVYAALAGLGRETASEPPPEAKLTPAQIRRSIRPEGLVSFEDGRPYKTLRRHLAGKGLTPEGYCMKWGLPADYPMVAASYSQQRSALAQSLGLGRKRVAAVAKPAAEVAEKTTAPKRRGRRKQPAA